ncbi:MAG: DUF2207 domain-containing protein [Acidobacteriota bacterium]|nr:MAG: DUF2207 domain-containing protein [Acidobacteriota bacterium]
MKRKLTLAIILFLSQSVWVWAKSYTIEDLRIEAVVEADGSLRLTESVRYQFKGSYSYAYREIPLKSGEQLDAIQVSEGSNRYLLSSDEEPGTYEIDASDNRVKVTWHFKARSETRTFNFGYTLRGVVKRYADVVELYYQFVGDAWEKSIDNVSVRVRFAEDVSRESLRAWAHGPLHGMVSLPADGSVLLDVSPLPSRTFWEGRILFDPSTVPYLVVTSDVPAKDRILAEEAAWAEAANRRRAEAEQAAAEKAELKGQLIPYLVLAVLMGAGVWMFLFFHFGKPHPVRRSFVPGEVPSDHPPALVTYLLHRSVGGGAIVLTLIDLARRGYLKITETVTEKAGWFGTKTKTDYRIDLTDKPLSDTAPFEQQLVKFMLEKAGNRQGFELSGFKKIARKNTSEFHKWFKKWIKGVTNLAKDQQFFENWNASVILANSLIALAVLAFGITFIVLSGSEFGVVAIFAGLIQAILSLTLSRRTEQGQRLLAAWKGYREHLKSIARAQGPVSFTTTEWSQHIVAAILFGQHKQLGKVLDRSVEGEPVNYFPWYAMSSHHQGTGLSGFGEGLSSMVTSVSTTMSSASGTGGGASGGGGGGSGGGGGGAG